MATRYSVGQSRRASDAMIPEDMIPEDMIPGNMIPDNEARQICIVMGNNNNSYATTVKPHIQPSVVVLVRVRVEVKVWVR